MSKLVLTTFVRAVLLELFRRKRADGKRLIEMSVRHINFFGVDSEVHFCFLVNIN
jgi:hypothetical protein